MTDPIDAVGGFYAALARGDVARVAETLHPDLHWTEAACLPDFSGTWRSPQEMVDKLLVPLARDWDGFSATATDFVAKDDRVLSIGNYAAVNKATGKVVRAPVVHDWRVRDGTPARFALYTDTWLVRRAMEPSRRGPRPARSAVEGGPVGHNVHADGAVDITRLDCAVEHHRDQHRIARLLHVPAGIHQRASWLCGAAGHA